MEKLLANKIGALVVCSQEEQLIGIISERDILKAVHENCDSLKSLKVSELMSTNLIVVIPEDEIDYIMGLMTQNYIRHLPIVNKERIIGIISIGDIVKFQLQEVQVKNRYLEEYMYGQ
jgi:CBS domain-containing protein